MSKRTYQDGSYTKRGHRLPVKPDEMKTFFKNNVRIKEHCYRLMTYIRVLFILLWQNEANGNVQPTSTRKYCDVITGPHSPVNLQTSNLLSHDS